MIQTAMNESVPVRIPGPPENSIAAHEETEESIQALVEALIVRCQLERCGKILPRHRRRFCSEAERIEYKNAKHKLEVYRSTGK